VGTVRLALALVALASVGLGFARVWPELGRQHEEYARWSDYDVAHAGALHEHLDATKFDRWRLQVRPGQRYWVDVPGINGFVYQTFATYWLLPAVPARTQAEADVVLR
jgi:hypothetical protein